MAGHKPRVPLRSNTPHNKPNPVCVCDVCVCDVCVCDVM